jgi:hypothetical protein
MSYRPTFLTLLLALAALALFTPYAKAQSSTAPTWADSLSQHHQLQYQMMKDMTEEMTRMTEQMSRGDLKPDETKTMTERMNRMAKMMQLMSGLGARPAHTHAQLQKQMDQMRLQMNEMKKNSQMAPAAR